MTSTRLYAGMRDGSLELFYIKEEERLFAIIGGRVLDYKELPSEETRFLDHIIDSEPETKLILEGWFPSRKEQKRKLAECRFGGLNFTPDYEDGVFAADSFDCPLKNKCLGFGKVCKSIEYKGIPLDSFDEKAISLLISAKKNTVIAEELEIPLGSFEVYRTKLYNSLRISTKQELASVAFILGLI
ncbi:response regulator transcription factor [Chryseobacterium vrystaatense]|uniref:DNA-binding transcriptional regulator, CsgD family n=1 Tax=Chryseobacterium vrystaatense TaxID=307480 RepID=A0ABR4UIC6_9FLAO|nr:response regulator transcription factor [Chryseobacterium vrystaatense]KFF24454.1 hypothetical protein IW16_19215 [Chryseobacterium vrystaatense]